MQDVGTLPGRRRVFSSPLSFVFAPMADGWFGLFDFNIGLLERLRTWKLEAGL